MHEGSCLDLCSLVLLKRPLRRAELDKHVPESAHIIIIITIIISKIDLSIHVLYIFYVYIYIYRFVLSRTRLAAIRVKLKAGFNYGLMVSERRFVLRLHPAFSAYNIHTIIPAYMF